VSNRPPDADIDPLTQSDLESFAARLQEWGAALPAKEQAVLALLLAQTGGAADVAGFSAYLSAGSYQHAAISQLSSVFTQGIGVGPLSRFDPEQNGSWVQAAWPKSGMPSSYGGRL